MESAAAYYFENYVLEDNNIIPVDEFLLWGQKALCEISALRMGRAIIENKENETIQQCICEIAEFLYENECRINTDCDDSDQDEKVLRIARRYFADIGLM